MHTRPRRALPWRGNEYLRTQQQGSEVSTSGSGTPPVHSSWKLLGSTEHNNKPRAGAGEMQRQPRSPLPGPEDLLIEW